MKRLIPLLTMVLAVPESYGQAPPSTPPPPPLHGLHKDGSQFRLMGTLEGTLGLVKYDTLGKRVFITWKWDTFGPEPTQHSMQIEATPFRPTEVVGAWPGCLAVAGKRVSRTVVELWRFKDDMLLPAPFVNPMTGEHVYPELHVPIVDKRVVYDEAVVGRDMVKFMFNIPTTAAGVDVSLLVQFYDSRDLYRIDLHSDDSTSLTKVASPVQTPGVLHVPALSEDHYVWRWAADHPTFGYVYFITVDPHNQDETTETTETLILFDSDRDQSLNGYVMADVSRWNGPEGWSQVSTYIAVYP